jgi:hypothetical protein
VYERETNDNSAREIGKIHAQLRRVNAKTGNSACFDRHFESDVCGFRLQTIFWQISNSIEKTAVIKSTLTSC